MWNGPMDVDMAIEDEEVVSPRIAWTPAVLEQGAAEAESWYPFVSASPAFPAVAEEPQESYIL